MNNSPRSFLAGLVAVSVAAGCTLGSAGDVFTTRPPAMTTDSGTPCTPSQDRVNWPVRVVLVVQNSGAMCIVDPPGAVGGSSFCEAYAPPTSATQPARISAINRFFESNVNRPNVSAAVVSWGLNPSVIPFSPTSAAPPAALSALQSNLGSGANLQSGLEAAKALIEQDVQATAASVRARSRYVVVVMSTGVPYPRCASNDTLTEYASAAHPERVWADSPGASSFCNQTMPNPELLGFPPGTDLNQNAQLFATVDGLLALDAQYGLGDVRVFTRLLMNDAALAACGPICADLFGAQSAADTRTMGTWLLTQLAQRGQGAFVDPGAPSNLSLSDIDTTEFTTFCDGSGERTDGGTPPRRVVVAYDASRSLAVTDSSGTRLSALNTLLGALSADPNAAFSVMAFAGSSVGFIGSNDFVATSEVTATQRATLIQQLGAFASTDGGDATTFVPPLNSIYQLTSADLARRQAAGLPRARYDIVFLSDGSPSTNQDDQLLCGTAVSRIRALTSAADDVRVHTVHVFLPTQPSTCFADAGVVAPAQSCGIPLVTVPGACAAVKIDEDAQRLQRMATLGGGAFKDFRNNDPVNLNGLVPAK
jgi:hypothetical protein